MKIQTGYPFYGQNVGVLVFSTVTPRIAGDAGNNDTFKFPICYEIVKGGFSDLIKGSSQIKENLLEASLNLKSKGVKTIVGDCGLMSLYQNEIAGYIDLPVAASSLCMIPTIWELIGRQGSIGIITGHSELLNEDHLLSSGWHEGIPLVIQGMEEEGHFTEIVINGGLDLDKKKMEIDVVNATNKLMNKSEDIKAILVECSNLGTYASIINDLTKLPTIDLISVTNFLEQIINPIKY